MQALNGIYPITIGEAFPTSHEWECRKCGQLIELPDWEGVPETLCDECQDNDDEGTI
jgi:uncharacterized paraquat-inducible protein A